MSNIINPANALTSLNANCKSLKISEILQYFTHQNMSFSTSSEKNRVESYHVCFSGARLLSPNETGHLFGTQFGTPFGRPRIFFQEVFLIEQGEGEGRVGNHRPGSFFLPLAIGLESPKKDRRIVFKASFFRGELSNFGGW